MVKNFNEIMRIKRSYLPVPDRAGENNRGIFKQSLNTLGHTPHNYLVDKPLPVAYLLK